MDVPDLASLIVLLPILPRLSPGLFISALVGVVSAAAFFLVAGRGFRSLPTYLCLGLAVAPLIEALGVGLWLPPPLTMGEVDLVAVAAGTWGLLVVARALRL